MSNPTFSIIIPVYKVEKYLIQCLESVKNQTYCNYEVILIDDGSPDKCPIICDEFAESEPRCKVIHQQNKGLSGARNAGLKVAIGKFVYFLDSDDTIADNALEKIHYIFENKDVDIVGFNATVVEAGRTSILSTGNFSNRIEDGVEIARNRVPLSTVPLYCYRRNLLVRENLSFKEGIYYEDLLFTAQVFLKNPKVYYMGENFYIYNKREESITTSKTKIKNYLDLIKICECLINYNKNEDSNIVNDAYKNIMKSYLLLSEEIYWMMENGDRKTCARVRQELMECIKGNRVEMGLKNYAIASFPRFFYIIREIRRKFKWQKQK